MIPRCVSLLLAIWCGSLDCGDAFSVARRRLPGIWKLKTESLPYEQDIRSKLKGLLEENSDQDILIKLNPDGSFKQCNEGYVEGRWMAGRWEINDRNQLVLALRRQYYGPQFDVLLEGQIDASSSLIVEGKVQKGKFMYPVKHPAFFDSPLVNQESLGNFTLEQSIAIFSITPVRLQNRHKANQFEKADFYDRQFIMTVEPLEGRKRNEDAAVDLRAMPVRFFRNSTFQVFGTNKILRGRFDVAENDELFFEVSLFGMGRSVSGSVYSEGLGLSYEDERSYVGSIEEQDGKLRVEGTVTFGDDMGSDARPEPVGTFILTESLLEDENLYFDLADEDHGFFE